MIDLLVLTPAIISGLLDLSSPNQNKLYVETESVPENSIFYVERNSAKAIERLGYDIYENNEGYCYKTTKEKQKIISVESTNHQLSKLKEQIVAVENAAISYQAFTINPDIFHMNNTTLGYLRSFNKSYVDDGVPKTIGWSASAGTVDAVFNRIADPIYGNDNYFSQFVSNNDYSRNFHSTSGNPHAEERTDKWGFSRFLDPITKRAKIDLIHMFASLDACYNYTLFDFAKNQYIPHIYAEIVHDLASWGGDLQQAANNIQKAINDPGNELTTSRLEMMNFANIMNGKYGFSEDDLYADIDAVNIANYHLTGAGRLSDALVNYYNSMSVNSSRSYKFVQSVLKDQNQNWQGDSKKQFTQEVYDVMGLSIKNGECVESDDYVSGSPLLDVKFKILNTDGVKPTKDTRKAVADKFCSYIFSLC